jgi:hypothetical protein
VFYFTSAPVTKKAYLIQRRFSSGKVAMDVIQASQKHTLSSFFCFTFLTKRTRHVYQDRLGTNVS